MYAPTQNKPVYKTPKRDFLSGDAMAYYARNKRLVMPSAPRVFTIAAPSLPEFKFEWHEDAKVVYLIRLASVPLQADPIAMHVPDHGAAINAVATWTRGYREGNTRLLNQPNPAQSVKRILT